MDDYMREMVDLKTLVTKTLEKKGVLARIRAELRANVFQAMEEQDHEAESNGSSTFSLLGTCNERAKKLHTSHSGKLLMALVCEYMEWCELEHTLKVYLPELNQPRAYNRAELEDVLGIVGEPKQDNLDSRPLLLTLVESFLKDEKKASSGGGPPAQLKPTRQGAPGGPRQISSSPPTSSNVDPYESLEARVSMANKKLSEKSVTNFHNTPFQSRSEPELLGGANDGITSPTHADKTQKVYEKSASRAQALLADMPPHRRSSGLPAFSGISRVTPNARGNNVGSATDQQSAAAPGPETGGAYSRGSRDSNNDQKRREYTWREEDELHDGSFLSKKKDNPWRDQDYDNPYMNPASPNTHTFTEKGDGKVPLGEHIARGPPTLLFSGGNPEFSVPINKTVTGQLGCRGTSSQTRRGSSMDNTGKAFGNLHLEDDSASDPGSRPSSGLRGTPTGQSWQPAPRENSPTTGSAGNKKQASAYFYSDSEEETVPEVPDEMRFEF